MGTASMARASVAAVFIVVAAGQAFSQTKPKSDEDRCRFDLSASRAIAGDSVEASKAYRTSGSDADFCAMIPASDRSIAAARKAIKSCQRLYPREMAEEHAQTVTFENLLKSQRTEYAFRCDSKAKAVILACTKAAKDMEHRHKDAIDAYASLHNQAPTSQTCSDLKYLQIYIDANKAVLKACSGATGDFSKVEVFRQLIEKVSGKISEFRAKYPGACPSR